MTPEERYELEPGEWRDDPPRIGYGADRAGVVKRLEAELTAAAWTTGEADEGPAIEVLGRPVRAATTAEDLAWLRTHARPAPYGRGEETVHDSKVRDARQIGAEHVQLSGRAWDELRDELLVAVARDMGLTETRLRLEPLKLLLYERGGHFDAHADTEKCDGMIASATLVFPGEYERGALVVEHADKTLEFGTGGAPLWRWAAWYADCRHRLEPLTDGVRIALTFAIAIDPEAPLTPRKSSDYRIGWSLGEGYTETHTRWAARGERTEAAKHQYGQKMVWVLEHRYTEPGLRASLLKGRDRQLTRTLLDLGTDATYLAWLEIRDIGSAYDDDEYLWGDHGPVRRKRQYDDYEPPPDPMVEDDLMGWIEDPAPSRMPHRATPRLHLEHVARQNAWIEGLRALDGTDADHGPIDVEDGEILPPRALDDARPYGARVYEATGNEGASLKLQYRHAVITAWRRNDATLQMFARCGGRLAIAAETAARFALAKKHCSARADVEPALKLWGEAVKTDGGTPAPRADDERRVTKRR